MNLTTLIRRIASAALIGVALLAAGGVVRTSAATAADYLPGVAVVGYDQPGLAPAADRAVAAAVDAGSPPASIATKVVRVPRGTTLSAELRRLRRQRGVAFAVPDYLAHIAATPPGEWIPNDPGTAGVPGGWEKTQWNFLPGVGVDAPEAWANLSAEGRPGARGVVIAVLDTGVAYRNWHQFRKSPDFDWTRFVDPWDFVANNRYPLDREGHGTFVTGTIAESTNNHFGLTGLAYGASIMPVRVLNSGGVGDAATIAEGIRYAVYHGAQVINLSLEFDLSVTAADIPSIVSALRLAHQHGIVVVGASGNDQSTRIAYPARASDVISVGATTYDRCRAYYSNDGDGLDLVAPGGGDDADLPNDPNCQPTRNLPDIYQLTFGNPFKPWHFSYPSGWYGTSMAAPHVAAAAAMVIASGVIGQHPSPSQVLMRLEETAQPLGGSQPNNEYGWGLVDIGAATARPGTPAAGPS